MVTAVNSPTPAISSAEVEITITAKSATVADDGYTTVISERVITDKADGKVISRENIRTVTPTHEAVKALEELKQARVSND